MSMAKGQYIAGKWEPGQGEDLASVSPSSGEPIWMGRAASPAQVESAFSAARAAFPAWARMDAADRIAIIERYQAIVKERADDMSRLISQESGKARWETRGEANVLAGKVDISIKAYHERTGRISKDTDFGHLTLRHRPHGVMAVMGPYNFPAHLPNGHIVPALIAGNTVVFKPSELTPAVGEALVDAFAEAGFPDGVINLVQGGRETGAAVLDNREVNGVLFTGSARTGAFIHSKFGGRPEVILALEMGGNNPLVISDVKDMTAAASIAAQSSFITTGQRCTCARRILIQDGKSAKEFIAAVTDIAGRIPQGPWDADPEPFMGPVISDQTASHIMGAFNDLVTAGGEVLLAPEQKGSTPAFVSPGIIDITDIDAPDEEIFGPIMQIKRVKNFRAALEEANNTRFGLAAGLLSDREDRWKDFTRGIRAGVVNLNRPTTGAAGSLPFGGPGASGNHRPGAYYAADYCAWPMASQEAGAVKAVSMPHFPDLS